MVRYIGGWSFLNVVYSTKNLSMQDKIGPFTFKKIINPFFSSFSFSRGKEKKVLMEGEGELSGAFFKSSTASRITSGTLSRGEGKGLGWAYLSR